MESKLFISNAESVTFVSDEDIVGAYGKDKNNVYSFSVRIKGVDVKTFDIPGKELNGILHKYQIKEEFGKSELRKIEKLINKQSCFRNKIPKQLFNLIYKIIKIFVQKYIVRLNLSQEDKH